MKKNHLGNNRYFLLEGAENYIRRINNTYGLELIIDIHEERIILKIKELLKNTHNFTSREWLEEFFGFAYITEDDYSVLTLHNNNYVFIDEEYYMVEASMNENGDVFVYCLNHEDETSMWIELL